MLLSVIFVVFLCACLSQGWNVDSNGRYPVQPRQQSAPGVLNHQPCYGMSRRTRQQKIKVPLIYNTRTGQSLPFPKFLYSAAPNVIARAEYEGWEVRLTTTYIPRYLYERVPVCCPSEKNCDQGRQVITSPAAENPGTCANGGQMIYRDGQQRCECAPGYQGIWCHHRTLPGDSQPHAGFPSGPLIRVLSAPTPYRDMVREAKMWQSKARHFPASPMLPVREHPAGAAAHWAYGPAAMMQHQMMQAKMAQMEEMYKQSYGGFNGQMPHQPMSSPDARRPMHPVAGNPYNVVASGANSRFRPALEANKNPYSTTNSQGQLPPDMLRTFQAVKDELRRKQALNPYSHVPQVGPSPRPIGVQQNVNGEHAGLNPYNSHPQQAFHVPQFAHRPLPLGLQQNVNGEHAGLNAYNGHLPQAFYVPHFAPRPLPLGLQQNVNGEHAGLNPYNSHPPQAFHLPQFARRPLPLGLQQNVNGEHAGLNPYNSHPPKGRDLPQPRTPWDLDPFGQQQNPSYMNYPGMPASPNRNKQAMAMVLYQQLLNQQKGKLSGRNDIMKQPTVNMVGVQTPAVVPQVDIDSKQKQLLGSPQKGSDQSQQVTDIPETTSNNTTEQQQIPSNVQPEQQQIPTNLQPEQQQIPTNVQPLASLPGQNSQQQPNSEEMKRIEQCQVVLTPRLSDCLKGYGLVMEQFMNPEYMQKAQAICQDSQSVGQCIMQHDQACGQGDAIMTTRKMINSVLHMMGMICQQIAARGEVPIVPGQSQPNFVLAPGVGVQVPDVSVQVPDVSVQVPDVSVQVPDVSVQVPDVSVQVPDLGVQSPGEIVQSPGVNVQSPGENMQSPGVNVQSPGENVQSPGENVQSPGENVQSPGVNVPVLVPEPLAPNGAVPSDGSVPPVEKVQEPPMMNENAQQQGEAQQKSQSGKSSYLNSVQDGIDVTEAPISKGHKGHDSAHPTSQDLKVLGYPLWLVITVGLGLFVVLILSVVIICLCCRRSCRKKSVDFNKEIEKDPASLERVCSIGIPPPSYNTTVLQQNDDGLDLPPLDTSVNDDEDEVKVPLESSETKGKQTNTKQM